MEIIEIHYDFTDGCEISYIEGENKHGSFKTHCLDFFCFSFISENRDVIVLKKDGCYISVKELLNKKFKYCDKDIKIYHNIHKMLLADVFKWRHK